MEQAKKVGKETACHTCQAGADTEGQDFVKPGVDANSLSEVLVFSNRHEVFPDSRVDNEIAERHGEESKKENQIVAGSHTTEIDAEETVRRPDSSETKGAVGEFSRIQ